jgi:hypothetical protein
MEQSGLGNSMPLILSAHQLAGFYHMRNNVEEALKAVLKIRFFIEPAQKRRMQLRDRLSNLFNIILLLQAPDQAEEVPAVSEIMLPLYRGVSVT